MNDEEKAALARQGLEAAELLEPGKIKDRMKDSVSDAASGVALRGLAALGRLAGRNEERSPARQQAATDVDVNRTFAALDAQELSAFETRLREAAATKRGADETRRLNLAELRRSFPEPSRELALLLFNCIDLLEELSGDAEGNPPASAEEFERKEKLLSRIAQLLAPKADEALLSFVSHVVSTSKRYRSS
jgi:hypothetical protein